MSPEREVQRNLEQERDPAQAEGAHNEQAGLSHQQELQEKEGSQTPPKAVRGVTRHHL